jgi:DNA repair exonuclease SbcCD ATPase subunit
MVNGRLRLLEVAMRNFLSYGNAWTVIDLTVPGTTLIVGEDLDSGTGSANGVGKTVILNAIVYGLFGLPLKKDMKLDSLINNVNKKNMEVKLKFEIGGSVYEVHRFRKTKAGTGVALYKDGELITPDSVDATNAKIVEIIGYSYDIFVRIVVYSANHQPFFELPTSGAKKPTQRDIIEELFGLTALTEQAKELKDQIKENEQRAGIIHAKIEQIDKEKARHEQQIAKTKQRIQDWEDDRASKITKLKKQLASVEGVDFEAERKLYEQRGELQTQRKETKSQVSGLTSKQSDLTSQKKKLEKEIKSLHDATCPYCNQQFAGAEDRLEQNETLLVELTAEMQTVEDAILKFGDELEAIALKLSSIDELITTSDLDQLLEIKNESANIVDKIEDLRTQVNPYTSTLEELLNMDLDEAEYTAVNELEDTINHQKFLHKLLTKEDSFVRKKLIDQNIPALNAKLKEYITDMGLPHKVVFTNTMEPEITNMGRPLEFANLSTGQQARVNFSLSLAFRAVLQKMFSPVNFSMVDEVLDIGLCPVGVKMAAKLLKKIAKEEQVTMFIISHRDELESVFDRTMKVQMKKGFSTIVVED